MRVRTVIGSALVVVLAGCGAHAPETEMSAATLSTVDVVTKGIYELNDQRFDEALGHLTEGFSLPPERAKFAHFNVGLIHYRRGDWVEAEQQYRAALAIDPNLYEAVLNLGVLLREQQRLPEATEMFKRIPDSAGELRVTSLNKLADIERLLGNQAAADEYAQQSAVLSAALSAAAATTTSQQ